MLICQKSVKQYALDCSRMYRSNKFQRVSRDFLAYLEGRVKSMIEDEIKRLPSIGKTIKAPR